MKQRSWLCALVALFIASGQALAWGPEGHQVVGSIADQLLNNHAKQKVAEVLAFELRVATNWADFARSVMRQSDGSSKYLVDPRFEAPCTPLKSERAGMEDYVSRNWSNC